MTVRTRFVGQLLIIAMAVLFAACTGSTEGDGGGSATTSLAETGPVESAESVESDGDAAATGPLVALPDREGPRRETTLSVPHVQLDAVIVPEVDAELVRRAFLLPGVEDRESDVSLPGARSLWLADDVELARPDVILSGREIGHIHPDGSLHLLLPVDRAIEVAETKWGELHPWIGRDDFWDGMVMVYTPETLEEVDITMRLIVDSYNFVTGADLDPEAFGGDESGSDPGEASESGESSEDDQANVEANAALLAALGVLLFTDDRLESPIAARHHHRLDPNGGRRRDPGRRASNALSSGT